MYSNVIGGLNSSFCLSNCYSISFDGMFTPGVISCRQVRKHGSGHGLVDRWLGFQSVSCSQFDFPYERLALNPARRPTSPLFPPLHKYRLRLSGQRRETEIGLRGQPRSSRELGQWEGLGRLLFLSPLFHPMRKLCIINRIKKRFFYI
jgi:hypothetical protein